MLNVKQIIDGYNKAILKIAEKAQPQKDEGKTCSCRKKEDCPLNGECLVREFICLESDCLIYTMISLERVNAYVMWERGPWERSLVKETYAALQNTAVIKTPVSRMVLL